MCGMAHIIFTMPKSTANAKPKSGVGSRKLSSLLGFDERWRARFPDPESVVIIGCDEVGRGCLAGPVVASAVILPDVRANRKLYASLRALDDSKKLLPETREKLSATLSKHASVAVGQASPTEIDEINILQASLLAMKRALHALLEASPQKVDRVVILIDGNKAIKDIPQTQVTVVQGDTLSASIAAASVVAKVFRDRLMAELAEQFPDYCWQQNKGYGSKTHRDAIERVGVSPWHRLSFSLGQELDEEMLEEMAEELADDMQLQIELKS